MSTVKKGTPSGLDAPEEQTLLHLDILPQPDDFSCGPTCLHAVYKFFSDTVPLGSLVHEIPTLDTGGTLAVLLGNHALRRGYKTHIYTYNLQVFDPTWFENKNTDLIDVLKKQRDYKTKDRKLQVACDAYIEFLELGGQVKMEDLTSSLIRRHLNRGVPILTGLSSTFMYRTAREIGDEQYYDYDDVKGEPGGHFVVLCGYTRKDKSVYVADPYEPNPLSGKHLYKAHIDRIINAILLGIVTYDANLLIVEPKRVH